MVLNPETSQVSPQFHVVLDDEFSTVTFTREDTIPPHWTDIVKCISQSGAPENIELKDTWFTPDLEEDPSEIPSHEPSIAILNNNKVFTLSQYEPHVQEIISIEGAYEVQERQASDRVRHVSNLKAFSFNQ